MNWKVNQMVSLREKGDALLREMEEQVEKMSDATSLQRNVSMTIKDEIPNLQRCLSEVKDHKFRRRMKQESLEASISAGQASRT